MLGVGRLGLRLRRTKGWGDQGAKIWSNQGCRLTYSEVLGRGELGCLVVG